MAAERESGAKYDLILAADVLPYVSDLTPLFDVATSLLMPDGLLAFTTETHAGDGVVLGENLRYAHSAASVRDALQAVGLRAQVLEHASTREEAGAKVPSLVAVAGFS
jgi:predicted TPR repeat methyltransferase